MALAETIRLHEGRPTGPLDSLDMVRLWRDYLRTLSADDTVRQYVSGVARFVGRSPMPLRDVTEDDVVQFLAPYPEGSSARVLYYYSLRSLFGWAERRGHIAGSPLAGLAAPKVREKEPESLTEQELERLLAAAHNRHPRRGHTIALLYYTGCRIGEAVGLRWSDISDGSLIIREPKGWRERTLPISMKLLAVLEGLRQLSDSEYVIGRAKQTVWAWVRDAARDAGIRKRVHPHMLRATFATNALVRSQGKGHVVKTLLGHRSLKTTERYWAVTRDDRREVAELL